FFLAFFLGIKDFLFTIIKSTNTVANIIVDNAFIAGFIPFLAILNTVIDKLLNPLPVVKNETTKSSNDNVNASKAPAPIPGLISCIIIFLKVYQGVATSSIAAAGRFLSICFNLGKIVNIT